MIDLNNASFENLVDSYLKDFWVTFPHEATCAGIHKYDAELDHVDKDSRNNFLRKTSATLENLKDFKRAGHLNDENLLDLQVLQSNLEDFILGDRLFNRYDRDPSIYTNIPILACMILLLRDFSPKEARYLSLISRLNEIPRFLMQAKDNLIQADSIPEIWLSIGRDKAVLSQHFFSDVIVNISGEIVSLKNEMLAAGTLASKAYKDFVEFLDSKLAVKTNGNFAAGREYFEFLVHKYHMLPYTLEELEEIGQRFIIDTTAEMKKMAERIEPGIDWIKVLDNVKSITPPVQKLLEFYRREIKSTRDFVIEKDLVSFPEEEMLEVMETPQIYRQTYPYAAYMSPGPFEADQRGFFWVTPVNENGTAEAQIAQLSGHSKPAIAVRSLHEGYPGHHLQFCIANKIKSKIRRVFGTSIFSEGWALYCEELMKKEGYYPDDQTKLMQLKDQLWRACRVVIDVRLHTGKISFDEAVKMLVDKARLEKSSAVAEIKRYTQSPAQPITYLIGKIEIEKLIADFYSKFPGTPLKEFHDRLLSFGTIPVALVRKSLMGTN